MYPQAQLTENENTPHQTKCFKVKATHFEKKKTNLTPAQMPLMPPNEKKNIKIKLKKHQIQAEQDEIFKNHLVPVAQKSTMSIT